ncbi:MAG TPA: DUF1684 domain-containing protein [Thermoanaerobaculia bacterium]|nr:DUF1684 domain-containing protein [Thermoanaerobaculia bacterium]
MRRIIVVVPVLAVLAGASACQQTRETPAVSQAADHERDVMQWRAKRLASLTSESGWLTLIGLDWLHEGENRVGSEKSSDVVLPPKVAASCGTLLLAGGKTMFTPDPNAALLVDGKRLTAPIELHNDTEESGPTIVHAGPVTFQVIKRNDRYALRVKDKESAARAHFLGLEYFPVDPKWRIEATFEPYNPPKKVAITNVLGMTSDEIAPGVLAFTVNGKSYRVEPILEQGEKDLFIIFKDDTAGKETYAAARYLYAHPPGADGKVIVDFNKAYNPPCAFTPFATCPLPPPQNRLPFRIEAGEKKYAGGHG